jgi:hypothetical protein
MHSNYKIFLGTTPVESLGEPRVNVRSFTFDLQNGLAKIVAEYSCVNTETKVKEFNVTTQELTHTSVVDLDNLRYIFDSAINNKSNNIFKTIFNKINKQK